ncbi:MAG: YbfB/YjiJ family MFS transporter [Armatimonadota bacterium]|nr:MAG: YbfB/YjiJ family MFS transporter [Armatimonadota bacterium]
MNGSLKPRRHLHYAWIVLAAGTLIVFGALGLARFGYTMVLPAMQAGLRLDNAQAGGLATANLVGYLALALIGGALAARYGPRIVITAGLVVAAIGMLLTGAAAGFAGAACWRMLTGIGSGASNVPVMGLMSAWFAPRRRGLAAGIAVTGSSLALIALGPMVPGILNLYGGDGWRVCWFLFAAVTGGLAILALSVLRNRPSSLGLRPLGEISDGTPASAPSDAMRWGTVYRSVTMWHVGVVYAAFGFSYIIYMTFFAKYLIAEGGYAPSAAGRLFMLMGWASLLCGLLWGSISDAIGRKGALAIVYLIQAAAFGLFALWPAPPGFILSAILFGLTAWSIPAIVAAACGDLLGPRLAPAGLGFVTLFFGIGQAAGPSVAGLLADATRSFQSAFLVAAGVALMGAVGSLLLRSTRALDDGAAT